MGILMMAAGIIACGLALGTMFTAQIGCLVIGGGAIILGIVVHLAELKG